MFPDALKAISQSIIVQHDKIPMVESLTTDSLDNQILHPDDIISDKALEGTALTKQDWRKAQGSEKNIAYLASKKAAGTQISKHDAKMKGIDRKYIVDVENYSLKDGILLRPYKEEDERFHHLELPVSLWEIVFRSYQDDLGNP